MVPPWPVGIIPVVQVGVTAAPLGTSALHACPGGTSAPHMPAVGASTAVSAPVVAAVSTPVSTTAKDAPPLQASCAHNPTKATPRISDLMLLPDDHEFRVASTPALSPPAPSGRVGTLTSDRARAQIRRFQTLAGSRRDKEESGARECVQGVTDESERRASRDEDRCVRVTELVPRDATKLSAFLRGPYHLVELPWVQHRTILVAEDQLTSVADGLESRRQLGCQIHPAMTVALGGLHEHERARRGPPDKNAFTPVVDVRPSDRALLASPCPRVERE